MHITKANYLACNYVAEKIGAFVIPFTKQLHVSLKTANL